MGCIEIFLALLFVTFGICFLLRNKIKIWLKPLRAKIKKKLISYAISNFTPSMGDVMASVKIGISESPQIEKHEKYYEIKNGDQVICIPFDDDLMVETLSYIVMLTNSIDGSEDKIISPEPGLPFLVSPQDLGFGKMVIMKMGKTIEEVEGESVSRKLNSNWAKDNPKID